MASAEKVLRRRAVVRKMRDEVEELRASGYPRRGAVRKVKKEYGTAAGKRVEVKE